MTEQQYDQLCAEVAVLTFLVETLYVSHMSSGFKDPVTRWKLVSEELKQKFQSHVAPGLGDPALSDHVSQSSQEALSRILDNIQRRLGGAG